MGNGIRYFRQVLSGLPSAAPVPAVCKDVALLVEKFIDERVDVATAIGRLVGTIGVGVGVGVGVGMSVCACRCAR
jgi:hypothetical protein